MSKIKVDIDRVNDLTPSFSQVVTKVSNTTDKVASIRLKSITVLKHDTESGINCTKYPMNYK
ncbi:hypothetical protein SFC08_05940 [Lysinibacillus halotolerans]